MLINYNGEWTEMVGDWPEVIEWDPSLLQNPDAGYQPNRGCPPGYVAIYVAPDRSWFWGTKEGQGQFVCRRADDSFINNPGAIYEAAGPDNQDAVLLAVADATKQTVEAVKAAGAAAIPTIGAGLGMIAVIVVGLLILSRKM
jgi:hypothetical protein